MRVVLNATKGAVERLGATVVDRVEKADWLVVDTRESLAFSKVSKFIILVAQSPRADAHLVFLLQAISRPGFVVGTLAHLFAQIRSESDSILDPYRVRASIESPFLSLAFRKLTTDLGAPPERSSLPNLSHRRLQQRPRFRRRLCRLEISRGVSNPSSYRHRDHRW